MPRPTVVTGGMYYVRDSSIRFPGEAGQERVPHEERRPVVVISGTETATDSSWPFVLVCPLSHSTSRKTRFCVKIPAAMAPGLLKTWVRVPAVLPLMKADLEDYIQALPEDKFQEIQARVAEYLGLLDEPEPPTDTGVPF